MTLNPEFELRNFTRTDIADCGAIFVKYTSQDASQGTVTRRWDSDTHNSQAYLVRVPVASYVTACAAVLRSSKNRYTCVAFTEQRIELFKRDSAREMQEALEEFFDI